MRLAFADTLTELADRDKRLIFLTADLGFQLFDRFIARHGPRYVNVGVAEAQMVCAAAGLALEGWRPLVYSIASFATARAYEHIKLSVAYANLPVLVVGAGGGFAYGSSGVTHHAAEDLGLMRLLPNMTVIAPVDAEEVRQLLPQALELKGPGYLRLGKGREPAVHMDDPAVLGKARLLRQGKGLAILSTGEITAMVAQAMPVLEAKGLSPLAYHFHTLKPLDTDALDRLLPRVDQIVVVEEHVPCGGLSCAVREWLVQQPRQIKLTCLTAPDRFILGSPHQHEARAHCGLDAAGIVRAVTSLC